MIDKLSRCLFVTSELKLTSVVSIPKFSYYAKKDGSYSIPEMDIPNVWLNLVISPKSRREMPFSTKTTFFLENEYYEMTKSCMTALNWFTDENMKDLFIYDEENKLAFNSAYNSLKISFRDSRKYPNTQEVTILPTLCRRGDNTFEGILIHLRDIDIQTTMTYAEFRSFVFVLKHYSYAEETFKLLNAYAFAERHKNVIESNGFSATNPNNKIDDVIHGNVIANKNSRGFSLK